MIEIGKIVNVAGKDFIVLDSNNESTLCLAKDFVFTAQFDQNSCNYRHSELRDKISGIFLKKIIREIGEENICKIEIDLTSDDGLDDYGKIYAGCGLLTCDMYRKYNRIIEQYPVLGWWWLATPYSTEHRDHSRYVRCVCSFGTFNYFNCDFVIGVRPFVNFKTSIFNL